MVEWIEEETVGDLRTISEASVGKISAPQASIMDPVWLCDSYNQIEIECLAITSGCSKFNQYFFGQKIIIETDYKPLVSIFIKPLNKCLPRLERMIISLNNYDFELRYVPGKKLALADHLSRTYLKNFDQSNEKKIEAFVVCIEQRYNITDERLLEIKNKMAID